MGYRIIVSSVQIVTRTPSTERTHDERPLLLFHTF